MKNKLTLISLLGFLYVACGNIYAQTLPPPGDQPPGTVSPDIYGPIPHPGDQPPGEIAPDVVSFLLTGLQNFVRMGTPGENTNSAVVPDFPKITTPNAASFDKFIDNPVSLYNGSADISIPIYTLKDGDIELPIVLRYNTSGIKVNEEAGWVGLGWNLNVGGVITQNVVGEYDDMDATYNTILSKLGITTVYNPYYPVQGSTNWVESFDLYVGSGNIGRFGKLNPDVFYYSYPGGAGKFIFDYRNDSIYILGRESAEKIEVLARDNTKTPSIKEFKITTTDGSQHYFSYFTKIYNSDLLHTSSVSYVLYRSIYPNGQQVDYNYGSRAIRKVSHSDLYQANLSTIEDYCDLIGYPVWTPTEEALDGTEFYLSNIQTTNYQINFETSDRSDLMNGLRLDKIKVYPKNSITDVNKIKEFVFEYDYFTAGSNTVGWKPDTWSTTGMVFTENQNLQRLKLLSVYEQNNTDKINKYNFTYDLTNLPAKTSYSVDYWGNYNGQSGGSSYLPDLKRLLWGDIITNNERSQKINEKYIPPIVPVNRGYDYDFCKAGVLTKITYPTGGTKEIVYEPNTFIYSTELPGAKDPIGMQSFFLSDYNQTTGGKSQSFTITANMAGKLEIVLSRGQHAGSYADGYFWWNLKGSRVTIINQGTGSIPLNYDLTEDCHVKGNCPDNPTCDHSDPNYLRITIDIPTIFTPGTYLLNVNMTDNIPDQTIDRGDHQAFANLGAILTLSPPKNTYIPLTPQEVKGCGIRVAQVINDFGDNNKTTTFFEYSGGILHDILQYVKVYDNIWLFYKNLSCSIADGQGQILNVYGRQKEVVEVFGNNTMSNPYASLGGVGYSSVKEITKSNDSNQGWTISEFNNKTPYTTQESVRVDDPLDGKPSKTTFYLNDNTIKKEVKYDYSYTIAHRYFGINFRKNINAFTNIFPSSEAIFYTPILGDPFYASKAFTIIAHPLNANDIRLDSTITTTDNVTVTENYIYNPVTLQLTSKKMSKSDGNNLEYKYSYPNDYAFTPYTDMVAKNILSPVVETSVFNNSTLVEKTAGDYALQYNSFYVPINSKYQKGSGNMEIRVTYQYDSKGNIQEQIKDDADKVVYLWGYNYQYPIVKIQVGNYTFAEIETAIKNTFGVSSLDALSKQTIPNETILQSGALQNALPNALVTTYTYKRLIGMTSVTDPRGVVTYYDYDPFGRLQTIKDMNNNIIENYEYHYKN